TRSGRGGQQRALDGGVVMDWRGGDWATQAGYYVGRCVVGSVGLGRDCEGLARAILTVVLMAGLRPYDIEADAEGEATGVALAPAADGSGALRVIWRPDPPAEYEMPPAVWNAQQAAMHQALRTILTAHGFRIQNGTVAQAPIVLGTGRPED
ncbi:hypothetical protein, partial [Streptomyces clavuligerus]